MEVHYILENKIDVKKTFSNGDIFPYKEIYVKQQYFMYK